MCAIVAISVTSCMSGWTMSPCYQQHGTFVECWWMLCFHVEIPAGSNFNHARQKKEKKKKTRIYANIEGSVSVLFTLFGSFMAMEPGLLLISFYVYLEWRTALTRWRPFATYDVHAASTTSLAVKHIFHQWFHTCQRKFCPAEKWGILQN